MRRNDMNRLSSEVRYVIDDAESVTLERRLMVGKVP